MSQTVASQALVVEEKLLALRNYLLTTPSSGDLNSLNSALLRELTALEKAAETGETLDYRGVKHRGQSMDFMDACRWLRAGLSDLSHKPQPDRLEFFMRHVEVYGNYLFESCMVRHRG